MPTLQFSIAKQYEFSSAHQLRGLRDGHPCGRLHGHNYTAEVQIASGNDDAPLDSVGMIVDYGEIDVLAKPIIERLDHRNLNDIMGAANPTAEHLARWLYHKIERRMQERWSEEMRDRVILQAVVVRETPKTWARYGV